MNVMNLVDHGLIVVLVAVVPLYAGLFGWPRMKRAMKNGTPEARIRLYWWTIVPQWTLASVLLVNWLLSSRSLDLLGFRIPFTFQVWLALGLVVALAAVLVLYQRRVLSNEEGREETRRALDERAPFLPRSRREMCHFTVLVFTAGFCEELLYRAFALWYLLEFLGTSFGAVAAAVIFSSVVFGVSHLYQGVAGMVQVMVVGAVAGVLYLYSECLWVVVLLHVFLDLNGGLVGLELASAEPEGDERGPAEAETADATGNS